MSKQDQEEKLQLNEQDTSIPLTDFVKADYQTTGYRWVVLSFCVTALVASIFIQTGFSAVAAQLAEIYGCADIVVVLCNLFFYFGLFVMTLPAVKIYEKKGIRFAIILASVVTLVGAWLRQLVMVWDNFLVVLIFTIPSAFTQVFYMQIIAKIPNLWFPDRQRVVATSIFGLAQPFGALLAFVMPAFFVNEKFDEETNEQQKQHFTTYLLIQNGIATVCVLPLIFVIRDKPKFPPSRTAFAPQPKIVMLPLLSKLFKNKDYILFIIYYTVFQTLFGSFAATISLLMDPYTYDSAMDISVVAGSFLICGVVASFLSGVFIDRTKKFKLLLTLDSAGLVVFACWALWSLPYGNLYIFSTTAALIGICIIPVIPLGFAYAVQLTYPIAETMSNGIMLMIAQLVSFLIGLLATYLSGENPLYAIGLFISMGVVAFIAIVVSKEKLRLQQAQASDSPQQTFED